MSKVTTLEAYRKDLSVKEEKFVENVAVHGMSYAQAKRHAGVAESTNMEGKPHVMLAIRERRELNAQQMKMTRDKVLEGLSGAIERAKLLSEPSSEIAGWREVAKICGFYDAPPPKKELTEKQQRFLAMIKEKSDDELLAMVEMKGTVIDGEAREV